MTEQKTHGTWTWTERQEIVREYRQSGQNRFVPTDPLFPIFQSQRRRSESQAPQPTVLRGDEVTQLTSDQWSRAPLVLAQHQLVPQPYVFLRLDLDQLQTAHILRLRRNPLRFLDRL